MISLLQQRWDNTANGFDGRPRIRIFQSTAAIVKTDDGAVARAGENAFGNTRRGELPVETDHAPHHTHQPKTRLHFAKTEPAHPEGRAHQDRRSRSGLRDGTLRAKQLTHYIRWTPQRKIRVRMRVVADF